MIKLVLGVLLWSGVHFIPAAATGFRQRVINKTGENAYKGLFLALMVVAIYLIISGWKATPPEFLYIPPTWGKHPAALLVLIAFILFSASHGVNNIKRIVRHPQLTAVTVWGLAHLLANGEQRSVVLFGGLTLWALINIFLLNRRDGPREIPEAVPLRRDVIAAVAGVIVYGIVAMSHEWLFGFSPFA